MSATVGFFLRSSSGQKKDCQGFFSFLFLKTPLATVSQQKKNVCQKNVCVRSWGGNFYLVWVEASKDIEEFLVFLFTRVVHSPAIRKKKIIRCRLSLIGHHSHRIPKHFSRNKIQKTFLFFLLFVGKDATSKMFKKNCVSETEGRKRGAFKEPPWMGIGRVSIHDPIAWEWRREGRRGSRGKPPVWNPVFGFGLKRRGNHAPVHTYIRRFHKHLEGFLFTTIATCQHLRIMPISKSNSEGNQVENEKGVEARLKLFFPRFFEWTYLGSKMFWTHFQTAKQFTYLLPLQNKPGRGQTHHRPKKKFLVIKQYCLVPIY